MYVLKERIETIANMIFAPDVLLLSPGKWSADNVTELNATGYYIVVPNLDYGQPYISTNAMHVSIFHTEYDKLSRAINAILGDLNRENPHNNNVLYAAAKAEGYLLHDIVAKTHRLDANDFIEGTDYYVAGLDILVQYVRTPPSSVGSQAAYIEA